MFAFHFLIDPELSPPISSSASMEPHWRYSDPLHAEKCLENHLQRGLNFQTCYSPCRIASWIYNGE